ncbi:hypothetical protein ILUMI_25941 [Ignelater luminosus]|uniref:Uncharacterized protein n=1 Tax=Ignelater luminosus TaxID=2038154 RepID=A0A8K0C7F5_IGNLU|nr:hypothetical protein ILUMI_25941 [Ignelater luminosus]
MRGEQRENPKQTNDSKEQIKKIKNELQETNNKLEQTEKNEKRQNLVITGVPIETANDKILKMQIKDFIKETRARGLKVDSTVCAVLGLHVEVDWLALQKPHTGCLMGQYGRWDGLIWSVKIFLLVEVVEHSNPPVQESVERFLAGRHDQHKSRLHIRQFGFYATYADERKLVLSEGLTHVLRGEAEKVLPDKSGDEDNEIWWELSIGAGQEGRRAGGEVENRKVGGRVGLRVGRTECKRVDGSGVRRNHFHGNLFVALWFRFGDYTFGAGRGLLASPRSRTTRRLLTRIECLCGTNNNCANTSESSTACNLSLQQQVENFWALENPVMGSNESLNLTTTEIVYIGDTRGTAVYSLEWNLSKDLQKKREFLKFISEYRELNHMELMTQLPSSTCPQKVLITIV